MRIETALSDQSRAHSLFRLKEFLKFQQWSTTKFHEFNGAPFPRTVRIQLSLASTLICELHAPAKLHHTVELSLGIAQAAWTRNWTEKSRLRLIDGAVAPHVFTQFNPPKKRISWDGLGFKSWLGDGSWSSRFTSVPLRTNYKTDCEADIHYTAPWFEFRVTLNVIFRGFPQSLQENTGWYLKWGHNRWFRNYFQYIKNRIIRVMLCCAAQ